MAIHYGQKDIETPIEIDIEENISHGIIVSNLAYDVGRELGLDDSMCYDLAIAGLLHDIGKIALISYINEKVDEVLAVDETRYMRMHPAIGHSLLLKYGYDQNVLDAVFFHHEHYDGTGYPHNAKGKDIPLPGRILHVCDIFGALISNRDYRTAFDVETALDIMVDDVKNFDMRVFLAFQRVAFSQRLPEIIHAGYLNKEEEDT